MGQDEEALSQAQQASEFSRDIEPLYQSLVAWAIARTRLTQGYLPEARLAFEEVARLGRSMGNIWTLIGGLSYHEQVLQAQGQLSQARAVLEEALTEASKQEASSRGFVAWVEDGLVSVLYEQNELEAANRVLTEAILLIRKWPNHQHLTYTYALQARILLAQGDLQGAQVAIDMADQIRRSSLLTLWLRRVVEAQMVETWITVQAAHANPVSGDRLEEQSRTFTASWRSLQRTKTHEWMNVMRLLLLLWHVYRSPITGLRNP